MRIVILLFLFIGLTSVAFANSIWPGLSLASRIIQYAIVGGILLEWAAVKIWWRLSLGRSFYIVFIANLLSALSGAIIIAVVDFVWALTGGRAFYHPFVDHFGRDTYYWLEWIILGGIAVGISYFVEIYVLEKRFKLPANHQRRLAFLIANILSTMIALISLYFDRRPL